METLQTLNQRTAIRSYTGEAPSEAALTQILQAAQAAPVAMGQFEHYHLSVISDPAILQAIDAAGAAQFGREHMLYGAPVFVVVAAKSAHEALTNAEYASAGIIVHNMALAAVDQGVASCYIWGVIAALNQSPAVLAQLHLPAGFIPTCGLTLGMSTQAYAPRQIAADKITTTRL
ncbi:nitroreductase family protein [Lacticaseibacillus baoqingensis]|uniref:Nitroreductase family protein n=1 Tax=Lacticaseibacillus baoqingensis TaxID=2486013 RepID=A0ABW4E5R5_9LACO|nr:nitroreductase family protein [Lacticaseibacillus baoqingensis]